MELRKDAPGQQMLVLFYHIYTQSNQDGLLSTNQSRYYRRASQAAHKQMYKLKYRVVDGCMVPKDIVSFLPVPLDLEGSYC